MSEDTNDKEYLAALQRIQSGVTLPPPPVPADRWNSDYAKFIDEFINLVSRSQKDHEKIDAPKAAIQKLSHIMIALCLARVIRDPEIVDLSYRMVFDVENPADIRTSAKIIKDKNPDAKVSEIVTVSHVNACHIIRQAVLEWSDNYKPLQLVERVGDEMMSLAMDHLDRTNDIASLIRRNITQSDRIIAALEHSDRMDTPLLDGAL